MTDQELLDILKGDPQGRLAMQAEIKRIRPDIKLPEYDTTQEFERRGSEREKALQAQLDEIKKKTEDRESRDYWDQRRSALRKAPFNLDDEEIYALEKRMVEDKITFDNHRQMAEYYQTKDQPLTPSGFSLSTPFGRKSKAEPEEWRKQLKDPSSELFKNRRNPKAWIDKQWKEAMNELQNGKARI
jgi:hypothetical protein